MISVESEEIGVSRSTRRCLAGVVLVITSLACTQTEEPMQDDLQARADELAQRFLIADTHIDVPYRLKEKMQDVSVRTEDGDFDYPRARAGGLDLAFMSIYVPASHQESGDARQVADELLDMMETLTTEHPAEFSIVTSVSEAKRSLGDGSVAMAFGMENGAPIQGSLENLRHFHERGIRYITLTHAESNHICDSSYDEERPWGGLSPFGREVVDEMNRLGMIIDVSHITDDSFFQVMDLSRAPVLATHSSCRHFTPGWERNMSDEMIRRLAAGGGVIHINFGSSFINDEYRKKAELAREEIGKHLEANDISRESDHADEYIERYLADHPIAHAELEEVVDHIDHVVELVGIDHVGLGSDFDGVGDSLPAGLEDVAAYPNLIRALLERGYSEEQVEKICSGNLMRVWVEVELVATELQGEAG
jgi:membrane dipeptidase